MKNKMKITFFGIALCVFLLAGPALAAGNYQIAWSTIDGGGGSSQSTDGQYTLNGTIGQPDAGIAVGGEYTLNGGFWQRIGAIVQDFIIHLPVINRYIAFMQYP